MEMDFVFFKAAVFEGASEVSGARICVSGSLGSAIVELVDERGEESECSAERGRSVEGEDEGGVCVSATGEGE